MPFRRTFRVCIALSLLLHLLGLVAAVLFPGRSRTPEDVLVVDLADLPRTRDFREPLPGILRGAPPPPPPPRKEPRKPEVPKGEILTGRVPDLPVDPNLPAEKSFPPVPDRKAPIPPGPVAPEATPAPTPAEKSPPAAERAEPAPTSPPPTGKTLRDLTPSLGQMVMARRSPGAGRGDQDTSGPAVGTGARGSERGEIEEERGGGAHLTPLNQPEIRYISYFAGIKRKIELVWVYPRDAAAAGIQGDLLIDFAIARDGTLASLALVRSSGHRALDEEAVGAIRKASPFAPIPAQYQIPSLQIRAHFIYEMHTLRIR